MLRPGILRLAHTKPTLRQHLVPILRHASEQSALDPELVTLYALFTVAFKLMPYTWQTVKYEPLLPTLKEIENMMRHVRLLIMEYAEKHALGGQSALVTKGRPVQDRIWEAIDSAMTFDAAKASYDPQEINRFQETMLRITHDVFYVAYTRYHNRNDWRGALNYARKAMQIAEQASLKYFGRPLAPVVVNKIKAVLPG